MDLLLEGVDGVDTLTLADSGVDMPIRHVVTKQPIIVGDVTMALTLLGHDSAIYRQVQRDLANKNLAAQQNETEPKLRDTTEDNIEILVRCTVGWKGFFERGTRTAINFTKDGAREFYRKYPPVREQAFDFITSRANFMRAPSKGSADTPSITSA